MNPLHVKQLVEGVTSAKVYQGVVPPNVTPAVGIQHVGEANVTRTLRGARSGKGDSWQLTLLGSSQREAFDLYEEVMLLDSTSDINYQRVIVTNVIWHDAILGAPVNQYTINVTTTNR